MSPDPFHPIYIFFPAEKKSITKSDFFRMFAGHLCPFERGLTFGCSTFWLAALTDFHLTFSKI